MHISRRRLAPCILFNLLTSAFVAFAAQGGASAPEVRAFWVDGFHAGIRSSDEVARLVADARRANINTLFVQVRRRGDALYAKSFEPPVEDPAYDGKFDGLAAILEAAHREGIQVHAWINAMPIWRELPAPKDPRHVFNQHGPSKNGEVLWLTRFPNGEMKFPVGYFLDPGHPDAAAYLLEVYLNIVRNYAVDGIHFDYIRYPETEERLPKGAPVGYNETSLARFRQAFRRTDTPAPDDPQWTLWRRQQVTQLVRRVYLEAKAINPRIKISAATIPWGKPPRGEKDFLEASPGQRIFQDWHGWLKEGILDLAVPMNYARESDATVRGWFDGWIRWEKKHKHGRQLAVGMGAYLNPKESILAQLARVRKSEGRQRADGLSFFSYNSLYVAVPPGAPASRQAGAAPADRVDYLSQGLPGVAAPFSRPAAVPVMNWIENPTAGWIAGMAVSREGRGLDGAPVELRKAGGWLFKGTRRTTSDGNGFFGFAGIRPGKYQVQFSGARRAAEKFQITVSAGKVSRVELKRNSKENHMKGDERLVRKLDELLADELTAIMQYMVHSEMCANWGYDRLHASVEKRAMQEMGHAEKLISRIIFLEGTPTVSKLNAVSIGPEVHKQLQSDLQSELQAVRMYNEVIHLANEVGDAATRALLESILKDEDAHVDWLEEQLDQIAQLGAPLYLTTQTHA